MQPQGDASGSRFATPAAVSGSTTCRRFTIPVEYLGTLGAILTYLTRENRWDDGAGGVSAFDASQVFSDLYYQFLEEGKCGVVGEIIMVATTTTPNGFLPCDGSAHNRVDYPALYAVLHPNLIVDADTFWTPNMVGRFPYGIDLTTPQYPPLLPTGANNFILEPKHLPWHTHTVGPHIHQVPVNVVGDLDVEGVGVPQPNAAQIIPLIASYTAENIPFETGENVSDWEGVEFLPAAVPLYYAIRY